MGGLNTCLSMTTLNWHDVLLGSNRRLRGYCAGVIAVAAAFLAWQITKSIFHDQWDFLAWGTVLVIFLILSGGVQWLEFRNAPPHIKFID